MKKLPIVVALTVVFIGLGAWYTRAHQATPSASVTKKTSAKVSGPVQVTLPGAAPITAIHEDYTKPTSLWVVVSKDHPLADAQYAPADLVVPSVPVNNEKSTSEQSLNRQTATALVPLFAAAKQAGFDLMVASGYRSHDLQETYFNNYAATYGHDAANKFSALPGQSEHQTGFALDISLTSRQCYLDTCFGDTAAGKWLAQHAPEYGFILRYPADKTDITKYQYEPWHFRYVGKDLANALTKSKLTLDEAYPYLQKALNQLKDRHQI